MKLDKKGYLAGIGVILGFIILLITLGKVENYVGSDYTGFYLWIIGGLGLVVYSGLYLMNNYKEEEEE